MEGELIFLGFIMLIGQIILMQMWQNGWFKKENFKIQKSLVMSENKLKMRKLEKEMGLTPGKKIIPAETPGALDKIGDLTSLIPLLKGLDADQISDLADRFLGGGESEGGGPGGDPLNMLIDYATRNPEMVEGLLKGLGSKNEDQYRSQV